LKKTCKGATVDMLLEWHGNLIGDLPGSLNTPSGLLSMPPRPV
jgi:hypothetical protein